MLKTIRAKIELETKLELPESQFHELIARCKVRKRSKQLNIYFDCDWLLADKSITCRVRFTDSGNTATLKLPCKSNTSHGPRAVKELEAKLEGGLSGLPHRHIDVMAHLPYAWSEQLARLGVSTLSRVGWMRNTRYLVLLDGEQFEMDEVILPNGSKVFEVEIESSDPMVHLRLVRFIKSVAPDARPSVQSKFQRFREAASAVPQGKSVNKEFTLAR